MLCTGQNEYFTSSATQEHLAVPTDGITCTFFLAASARTLQGSPLAQSRISICWSCLPHEYDLVQSR